MTHAQTETRAQTEPGVAYAAGSLISARGREWVVLPESAPDMLVLRPLGGADDEITAVFPDLEEVTAASFPPPEADDLGDAQAAGLLRTALRIGFNSTAGPFRSVGSIAVEPRPYQLVPLLMAMRQDTVRLAICDDVGIGKTIESGLIAKELLAQGSASGLAVLCSPALAEQWQDELRTKFGIDAELILASTVPRLERALDWGKTLFEKHRITVVSTDFIKSQRHRHDFIKHCPDLVIVDEAHTCVPADRGTGTGNTQQLRYDLLTRLAADRDRHLLLVTATPHSGKDESFRALLGLLDSDLETIDFTSEVDRARLSRHYVQRRRYDIKRLYPDEGTAFAGDRKFGDADYSLSAGYRDLLDDAIDYARERVTNAAGQREERIAWWSAIALLRSLVSSPRAAAQTLRTRAQSAAAATAAEADVLGHPVIADMADDNPDGIDATPGADAAAGDENGGAFSTGVDVGADSRLAALAERAAELEGPTGDRKLALLVKTVKQLLKEGYSPIVFCRYIPTSEYVAEHLDGKLGRNTVVAAVNGTLSAAQRLERIEKLSLAADDLDDGKEEVRRVLVATDCLSEGVNLQKAFNAVVHYDLAWNPTRHEQREGRVDRFGQESPEVKVVTIYGSDNGIDGKVLEVLIRKHREIRKSTGISVPVPDETSGRVTNAIVDWVLRRGREQATLFGDDELKAAAGEDAGIEWTSMAERESRARSRYAQGSIHPDEVAREAAAIRAALGPDGEVAGFTRAALTGLGASVAPDRSGGFTVPADTLPGGLRDAIAALIGDRKRIPFRKAAAVSRGEASLSRTDPVVSAVASHVLSAALDEQFGGPRPARRCGVIRTSAVTARTVVLLARYRYQLILPGRHGDVPLIAEDARVLAFTGTPGVSAEWLPDSAAAELLEVTPDENATTEFAKRSIGRIVPGLGSVSGHLRERGGEFAEELRQAHRRVRQATDTAVRGLQVTLAGDADILGVYLYLPTDTGLPASAEVGVGSPAEGSGR